MVNSVSLVGELSKTSVLTGKVTEGSGSSPLKRPRDSGESTEGLVRCTPGWTGDDEKLCLRLRFGINGDSGIKIG